MKTVRTEEELKSAIEGGSREIEVQDKLADALHGRRQAKKKVGIGAALLAGAGIMAAPFTGGASLVATGPSVATILAVSIGAGLLMAIREGYEEVAFTVGPNGATLRLRRKRGQ